MWNKKKEIEGVSSSSLVTLKSIVSNEELLKGDQDKTSTKVRKTKLEPLTKNKGVADRVQKDLDTTETETKTLDQSHRALIAKTKLYQKLSNNYTEEYEKNQDILVDFLAKDENNRTTSTTSTSQQQRTKPSYNPDYDEMKSLWEKEKYKSDVKDNYGDYADDYNDDDDQDEQERKRKEEKIRDMIREEESTKTNRDKVQIEKNTTKQEKLDRLAQIQQKKKLALLKQKLNQQKK
ncbi:hypothetical protein CYY_001620 [Polysphondylium violaceum]|uniref:Uncharacterized protein n=1 Tax=Polysphondylium violaceum TaxID=133409 RepID=A0A8J4V3X9_9MYCE|nr:hypothetical protein CYY_001620 [Polysphondylium violaceum]